MKKYSALLPLLLSISLSTTSCASSNVLGMPSDICPTAIEENDTPDEVKMDAKTLEYYNYFNNLEFTYNYQE